MRYHVKNNRFFSSQMGMISSCAQFQAMAIQGELWKYAFHLPQMMSQTRKARHRKRQPLPQCLWAVEEQRGRSTAEPGCTGVPGWDIWPQHPMEISVPLQHVVAFLCRQLSSTELCFHSVFSPLQSWVSQPAPLGAGWAMPWYLQILVIIKRKSPHLVVLAEQQQQE